MTLTALTLGARGGHFSSIRVTIIYCDSNARTHAFRALYLMMTISNLLLTIVIGVLLSEAATFIVPQLLGSTGGCTTNSIIRSQVVRTWRSLVRHHI